MKGTATKPKKGNMRNQKHIMIHGYKNVNIIRDPLC